MESREIGLPTMEAPMRIVEGRVYRYLAPPAKGQPDCRGQLYKVKRFVKDVPSYQEKVVVEGLTGPDKGLWYTCSLMNFATRFEPTVEEIQTPQPASYTDSIPTSAPVPGGMELSITEGSGW